MSSTQEQNYIDRCRCGDGSAFGPLIRPYRRQLFSYLFKLSGDRIQSEDLFQETLIKTWRGIKNYSERQKFSSWLFTIAHNAAMDHLRIRKKERVFQSEAIEEVLSREDPLGSLIEKETKQMIDGAINILSDKQKNVLLLRLYGEMSFKEISDLTNEGVNTVLSHMHYAVKKLKKIIEKKNV